MYNDNPTLKGLTKVIDEQKQGEVFFKQQAIADAGKKKFYIESYGCQMNFSDSEIVASILGEAGFVPTRDMEQSDLILILARFENVRKILCGSDCAFLIR
jgi:tRNA-2-methylthio-N6-dimethylallyladenosine synthase